MKRKTANVLGVLLCWALAFIGVLFYWTHKDAAFYFAYMFDSERVCM